MDAMLLDLRVILSGWRRGPSVALAAVVVLGLGVGVLTGILTLLQRVVVDRLPVRAPEELAKVVVDRGADGVNHNLSLPMLEALLTQAGLPTRIAGHSADNIINLMAHDKKLLDGQQRWILPLRSGGAAIHTGISLDTVRQALRDSGAD